MTEIEDTDKESKDGKDYQEREESPETSEQSRSKIRAVKILGNRQLSSREMEKRLVRKGESEEAARETVQWLENIGAVNDVEYAAAIVRHYSTKGYGVARIKTELHKRGIQRAMWDDALTSLEGVETDEVTFQFLNKRLRGSDDKNDLRRAIDALCRRGFSYEDARSAVNRYLESIANTEESDDTEQ